MLVSASEFSRLAGVSRQAIAKLVKDGNLVKRPNGKMDTEHPVNHEYIHRERDNSKAPKEEGPKVRLRPKKALEKIKPKTKTVPERPRAPKEPPDLAEYETILDPANVKTTVKADLEKIKLIKACRDLDLNHEIKRKNLIDRNLIRAVFSKKYEIDMASYLTIKDKLMPDIAAIFEISDPEKMVQAGERMDEELWKILKHTKALFNEFLNSIKSEEL